MIGRNAGNGISHQIESVQSGSAGGRSRSSENTKIHQQISVCGIVIKWIVLEYDNLRILKIYENDKVIFVLINSNTQLEHTVDNILGYYYDLDEIPKSLF